MKESIIIRNFGAINEVELDDIRPLTVFIGESGSGKSTIMKVIILFRWIYKMVNIRSYLRHSSNSDVKIDLAFKRLLTKNGMTQYLKDDTEIIYSRGKNTITYSGSLGSGILIPVEDLSLDKMSFIGDKRNIIPDILSNKMDRSSLSFYLKETLDDTLLALNHINQLELNYLGVEFVAEKTSSGTKFFIKNASDRDDYSIDFDISSSGTQTVVPLSLIVEYYSKYYDLIKEFNKTILRYMSEADELGNFKPIKSIGKFSYKKVHIHIEEPELSLFPESQRSLLNFIVNRCFIDKPDDHDITVMMATHSPYIVNHLNLLIMAAEKNIPQENAMLAF